jgi:hypothetical protein
MMTTADVSVNLHMRDNKLRPFMYTILHILAITIWFALAEGEPRPGFAGNTRFYHFTLVEALPWVYLLFRWTPVLDLDSGYPTFTDIFVMYLMLCILDVASDDLYSAMHRRPHEPAWPFYFFMLTDLLKAGIMWFVYTRSTFLEGVNSRFYTSMYVYLLLFGIQFFARVVVHR